MTVEIRSAGPGDAEAVAGLALELGYDPAGVGERLAAVLSREDAAVLVAVAEDRVVGWVHVHDVAPIQVPRFAEVGGLVVAEAHRGTGVGARLLEAAERWAGARRHTVVRLRSNAIREGAHRFYLRHGYLVEKTSLTFTKAL